MATDRPTFCICNPIYHLPCLYLIADYYLHRNIDDRESRPPTKTQLVNAHSVNHISSEFGRQIDDRPTITIRTQRPRYSSGSFRVRASVTQYFVMASCRRWERDVVRDLSIDFRWSGWHSGSEVRSLVNASQTDWKSSQGTQTPMVHKRSVQSLVRRWCHLSLWLKNGYWRSLCT